MTIPFDEKNESTSFKDKFNCENCDPTDKYHKYDRSYKTSNYKWTLVKIRVLQNGRHNWINLTLEFNKNYICDCLKCRN